MSRHASLRIFAPLRTSAASPSVRPSLSSFASSARLRVAGTNGRQWLHEEFIRSAYSRHRPNNVALYPRSTTRLVSTRPFPQHRGPLYRFVYRSFAYAGAFILISGGLVIAFFLYDASTYREDLSYTDIPVSEQALNPKRGGPKNLPIAESLVSDDDCPENSRTKHKPRLVIVGSGWGSVALLKQLNPEDYHVTVVSPVNYFLFTPMLPSATVGTLELRSLVEPVRRIVQRVKGHFLKAEAVDVELSEKLLEVAQSDSKGQISRFYLPYDKLVLGVGKDFSMLSFLDETNKI